MIEFSGDRHYIGCPMVMDNAQALLLKSLACLQGESVIFDLSRVEEADSSALAVMLGLTREAQAKAVSMSFVEVPEGVVTLARLYGIDEFLALV